MSKLPKRNRKTLIQSQIEGPGKLCQFFSSAWTIFGGVALLLGLAASVITFLPRMTVEVRPIDPMEPHKTEITIANTGYVTLKNVKPTVGLCSLLIKDITHLPEFGCDDKRGVRLLPAEDAWFPKQLNTDEKYTIRLDDLLDAFPTTHIGKPSDFQGADITVIVDYEVRIIPFIRREAEFRFFTRKEKDGKLLWMQRPLVK